MITLKNDFHQTSVTIRVAIDGIISEYQARKITKTLCGIKGCYCGNELGMRGKQDVQIVPYYSQSEKKYYWQVKHLDAYRTDAI